MRVGIFPSRYAALGLALATLAAFTLLLVPSVAHGLEQGALPDPAAGYDWKKIVGQKTPLASGDVEKLARDKILVGPESYKQDLVAGELLDVP